MRHPLHAICPYFAMFPEGFVSEQLLAFTRPGDLVFDPFCGRGTTILECRLSSRGIIGTDVNPVAACISGAKAKTPTLRDVRIRLQELKATAGEIVPTAPNAEFFRLCFHADTLKEICSLRERLKWRRNHVDPFIAALVFGALHGESHRSERYLSNRMPRTISTKPDYSVRWWQERGLKPRRRDVFSVLLTAAELRLAIPVPTKSNALVREVDARNAAERFSKFRGNVKLIVTSPPYL